MITPGDVGYTLGYATYQNAEQTTESSTYNADSPYRLHTLMKYNVPGSTLALLPTLSINTGEEIKLGIIRTLSIDFTTFIP